MRKDAVVRNIINIREENHEDLFVIQSRKENRNLFIFFPIFILFVSQLRVYFELHLCLFTIIAIIQPTIGQTGSLSVSNKPNKPVGLIPLSQGGAILTVLINNGRGQRSQRAQSTTSHTYIDKHTWNFWQTCLAIK